MSAIVRCPGCDRPFDVTGVSPGKAIRCKGCGAEFPVPAPPAPPPPRAARRPVHSFGVASLVLGVAACALACLPLIALPLGAAGFILGLIALGISIRRDGRGAGYAAGGLAASIVAIAVAGVMFFHYAEALRQYREQLDKIERTR